MKRLPVAIILIAASFIGLMLACGSPTQLVTKNLREEDINRFFQETSVHLAGEDWSFLYQQVDLQKHLIRISGALQPQNQPDVPGALNLRLSVEDGKLKSEILSADFGEVVPEQTTLNLLNQQIQKVFSDAISEGKQGVQFIAIDMLEDLLKVQLRFLPPQQN